MEPVVIAGYFACAFVGLILGLFLRGARKSDGVLKVDVSDPKRDRYLMEFHIPIEEIPMKKHVHLRVVNIVNDSQKFLSM